MPQGHKSEHQDAPSICNLTNRIQQANVDRLIGCQSAIELGCKNDAGKEQDPPPSMEQNHQNSPCSSPEKWPPKVEATHILMCTLWNAIGPCNGSNNSINSTVEKLRHCVGGSTRYVLSPACSSEHPQQWLRCIQAALIQMVMLTILASICGDVSSKHPEKIPKWLVLLHLCLPMSSIICQPSGKGTNYSIIIVNQSIDASGFREHATKKTT